MIVADSDVLIDFLRGQGGGAARVALELETGTFCTTAIAAFELRSGAHSARQRKAVGTLLDAMTILPLGAEEARIAAGIRQRLERQGQRIGMADYVIAGVCIAREAVLVTRNVSHFDVSWRALYLVRILAA